MKKFGLVVASSLLVSCFVLECSWILQAKQHEAGAGLWRMRDVQGAAGSAGSDSVGGALHSVSQQDQCSKIELEPLSVGWKTKIRTTCGY